MAIIILVALALVGAFIWYNERREKSWQAFLDKQRLASEKAQEKQADAYDQMLKNQQDYWCEQRADDRKVMGELVTEIRAFRGAHQEHDKTMIEAITRMEERTRPVRRGAGDELTR